MDDLLVIVPTRGRPDSVPALIAAWDDTAATADLLFAIDTDDPQLPAHRDTTHDPRVRWRIGPRLRLCGTLNAAAIEEAHAYQYLAFLGDDHRPRTAGWDAHFRSRLAAGPGIVYGNDLLRGEALPTAAAMTASIAAALGYLCPPGLIHLFVDNVWLDWGRGMNALTYLPDVIIEHMHPAAGKADNDHGYLDANSPERFTADRDTYLHYCDTALKGDLQKLTALKEEASG